jgi:hypothetical protein
LPTRRPASDRLDASTDSIPLNPAETATRRIFAILRPLGKTDRAGQGLRALPERETRILTVVCIEWVGGAI